MDLPIGYLLSVLFAGVATACALWPRPTHGPRPTPSFMLGTVAGEAPFFVLWYLVLSTWLAWFEGDLTTPAGLVVAGASVVVAAGLARIVWQASRAGAVLDRALDGTLGADRPRQPASRRALLSLWALIAPIPALVPGVQRVRNIAYGPHGRANLLDLYRRRGGAEGPAGPALVYLHAGGFFSGRKSRQARLLLRTMARRGWVCVSANYRLSPHALFPDNLVDAKLVIAWLRAEGHHYGADAGTLVVSGGSAGAHLAMSCAFTPGRAEYQPGFEDADTRVSAAIGLYGYYGPAPAPEGTVSDPVGLAGSDAVGAAGSDAVPLLVVHGAKDPMTTARATHGFIRAVSDISDEPIVYAELPGGLHNFDLFSSLRHAAVTVAVVEFTSWLTGRSASGA